VEDRTTIVRQPTDDTAAAGRRSPVALVKAAFGSTALRVGFVVVAVGLGAYAVVSQWSQVRSSFAQMGVGMIAAALALALLISMEVWRSLLTAAGSRVPFPSATRIFFVGQIGKYLPGAVWPVLAQMELGQAHRIPRRRSATVAVVTLLVSLVSGLLVATVAILGHSAAKGYAWAFLAVPVLLVGLHPRVLNPLIDRLLRLARRPALEVPLTGRAILTATLWSLLAWVVNGTHVYLLSVSLGAPAGRTALLAIGGFAFAWCVGFLVVFAPAGAGVRDVILVASLSPVLDVGQATAVALVSRVLTTVADLLCAGIAAWFGRGHAAATAPVHAGD
jgi:hypothetical protein